jgi:hypothetical protein
MARFDDMILGYCRFRQTCYDSHVERRPSPSARATDG